MEILQNHLGRRIVELRELPGRHQESNGHRPQGLPRADEGKPKKFTNKGHLLVIYYYRTSSFVTRKNMRCIIPCGGT